MNKVLLMGRLTRDSELHVGQGKPSVLKFSLATNEKWKNKTGAPQEKTEFHNIVAFNALAEIAGKTLKKGHRCLIEGKLQTRTWEKDGVKHYSTEIVADQIHFLEKRPLDEVMEKVLPPNPKLDNSAFGGHNFATLQSSQPSYSIDDLPF